MKKTYGSDNYVIDLWTGHQIHGRAFTPWSFFSANFSSCRCWNKRTIDRISITQLQTDLTNASATGLFCINNCLDPKLLNDRYTAAANALADNDSVTITLHLHP